MAGIKFNGVHKCPGRPTLVEGIEGRRYVANKILNNLSGSQKSGREYTTTYSSPSPYAYVPGQEAEYGVDDYGYTTEALTNSTPLPAAQSEAEEFIWLPACEEQQVAQQPLEEVSTEAQPSEAQPTEVQRSVTEAQQAWIAAQSFVLGAHQVSVSAQPSVNEIQPFVNEAQSFVNEAQSFVKTQSFADEGQPFVRRALSIVNETQSFVETPLIEPVEAEVLLIMEPKSDSEEGFQISDLVKACLQQDIQTEPAIVDDRFQRVAKAWSDLENQDEDLDNDFDDYFDQLDDDDLESGEKFRTDYLASASFNPLTNRSLQIRSEEESRNKTGILRIPTCGVVRSSRGTVELLVHANGRTFKPAYNLCGMLVKVTISDGRELLKVNSSTGEEWRMYEHGKALKEKIRTVAFDKKGNVWYQTKSGKLVTYFVDGNIDTVA